MFQSLEFSNLALVADGTPGSRRGDPVAKIAGLQMELLAWQSACELHVIDFERWRMGQDVCQHTAP